MTPLLFLFDQVSLGDNPYYLAIFSSLSGAIFATFFTIWFTNFSNFSSAKKGLKSEINYNLYIINTVYPSIKAGIDAYNQYLKNGNKEKYATEIPDLHLLLNTSGFNYFTYQGYLQKIDTDSYNSIILCYDLFSRINILFRTDSDITMGNYRFYQHLAHDRSITHQAIIYYCDDIRKNVTKINL